VHKVLKSYVLAWVVQSGWSWTECHRPFVQVSFWKSGEGRMYQKYFVQIKSYRLSLEENSWRWGMKLSCEEYVFPNKRRQWNDLLWNWQETELHENFRNLMIR
jgi:hypothetical protein